MFSAWTYNVYVSVIMAGSLDRMDLTFKIDKLIKNDREKSTKCYEIIHNLFSMR